MKICPKCGASCKDDVFICNECYTSLNNIEPTNAEEVTENFFKKEAKKDKIKHILSIALLPIFSAIYIPFAAVCVYRIREFAIFLVLLILYIAVSITYYLSFFKPEVLFILSHMLTIDNIDDVELSSWYYFTEKLGAVLALVIALFMVIYLYCTTSPALSNFTSYIFG